jgi:hypothetical protein
MEKAKPAFLKPIELVAEGPRIENKNLRGACYGQNSVRHDQRPQANPPRVA